MTEQQEVDNWLDEIEQMLDGGLPSEYEDRPDVWMLDHSMDLPWLGPQRDRIDRLVRTSPRMASLRTRWLKAFGQDLRKLV